MLRQIKKNNMTQFNSWMTSFFFLFCCFFLSSLCFLQCYTYFLIHMYEIMFILEYYTMFYWNVCKYQILILNKVKNVFTLLFINFIYFLKNSLKYTLWTGREKRTGQGKRELLVTVNYSEFSLSDICSASGGISL